MYCVPSPVALARPGGLAQRHPPGRNPPSNRASRPERLFYWAALLGRTSQWPSGRGLIGLTGLGIAHEAVEHEQDAFLIRRGQRLESLPPLQHGLVPERGQLVFAHQVIQGDAEGLGQLAGHTDGRGDLAAL